MTADMTQDRTIVPPFDIARQLFRAMTADEDGLPMVGATARTLGARPRIDVPGDPTDEVEPQSGGMSGTVGDPSKLPIHRRPAAFGGTGSDPVFVIDLADLGPDLVWRADGNGPSGHGFLEPVRRMPFNEYQEALRATRSRWRRVDR